jgi:predicted phosphohydrolase
MSLFVIADLHLPGAEGERKSMSCFGRRWIGAEEKLIKNWNAIITEADSVVIPGDISWAMTLEEAKADFELINSLPGTKYIGKGNHDFWWTTASKITAFFKENSISTIKLLHNNSYLLPEGVICGTRGWFPDEANQKTVGEVDWKKIVNREAARLEISIESGKAFPDDAERIVFLHFPPVWSSIVCEDIISVLKKHSIKRCYYGHIHGIYTCPPSFEYEGIVFEMISADYLDFIPKKIANSPKSLDR